MSDFKTIARILGAIRSCEGRPFDVAAVSPEALGVSEEQRVMLACKLQRAGKVGGLMTTEDIDGAPLRVLWAQSEPEVTLDGLEYMATCEPLRSAAREVVGASVSAAVSATAAALGSML
ncbi:MULTISPECIES: YjcQ family protein [unclassified Olsenella]|jgi:hypothetical protein|uniref:YjcQ family protein n=1 Tax=unclassified Olsenella TaxID=2638792 RepID=UPI000E47ACA0|nr:MULTISPECIES: YjcQ family protein [unclassified Olsenella]RGS53214.1 hypothetical protein DWX86_01455 [Olsenella sp. AF21-51]RHB57055.1 hypothetical protein DW878_03265 [Olsenella sp. AM39-30AC]